jgi:hypothetical protein
MRAAAEYLETLKTVDESTIVPGSVLGVEAFAMYLWTPPPPFAALMTITRDYYRDVHMTPMHRVPTYLLSAKPHPA